MNTQLSSFGLFARPRNFMITSNNTKKSSTIPLTPMGRVCSKSISPKCRIETKVQPEFSITLNLQGQPRGP